MEGNVSNPSENLIENKVVSGNGGLIAQGLGACLRLIESPNESDGLWVSEKFIRKLICTEREFLIHMKTMAFADK